MKKFSQSLQDSRTFILETLIRTEGHLDNRMYNCADLCVNFNKLCTDEILKEWDNYKKNHPDRKITPL